MIEALFNASNGPTTIIIAHRISRFNTVTALLCLQNQIIAAGTHKELIEKEGLQSHLAIPQWRQPCMTKRGSDKQYLMQYMRYLTT